MDAPRTAPDVAAELHDEFPFTPARAAVVALVRGFGALQRRMGPYFAGFGLTPPQFQMLTIVNRLCRRGTPPNQRRLAAALYVSFPNITVMLARLERAGLIRRRAGADDGREKRVELTARGRARLLKVWTRHARQLESVTAGLSDPERLELARLLNQMTAGPNRPRAGVEPTGPAEPAPPDRADPGRTENTVEG
jgi:DNA-binding MarR family transcriptional regulator